MSLIVLLVAPVVTLAVCALPAKWGFRGKVGLKPQRPHDPQTLCGEEVVVPPVVGRLAFDLAFRARGALGLVVVGGEVDGLAYDRQYGQAPRRPLARGP